MRLSIIAIGKINDAPLRGLIDDYYQRMHRYARIQEFEIKDNASPAKLREQVLKRISASSRCVALEVKGKSLTSPQLATRLQQHREQYGVGEELSFLIGGAYGLPPELHRHCHWQLSLSSMTLPHRLARLVLVEQLYRALSILQGDPYAHED